MTRRGGARTRMIQRARVVRDDEGAENILGQRQRSEVVVSESMPCRLFSRAATRVVDNNKIVSVAVHRLMAPAEADIQDRDRVTRVTDRRGNAVSSDTLSVVSVATVPGETHKIATLEDVI